MWKLENSDFKMSLCEKSEDQDSIMRSSSPESSCNQPMKSSTFCDASMTSNLRYLFAALIFVIIALVIILPLTLSLRRDTVAPRDKCYAKAAVAADAETCSEIGRDILKRKGSAVDAAIAALLCLSVVNPQSMGIGGGVVFTIYNASTGLLIAVPGELRGYEMAHKRHGKLPWRELFQPSIKLAREGFKIGKALAKAIAENEKEILSNETMREVFCKSNPTTILKENDIITFPRLAKTYENISKHGSDVFFNGSLTEDIVNDINAAGYSISSSSVSTTKNKILTYHRMIEAFHFADALKSKLGDPRDENITETIKNMTSKSFADDIRSKIKDDIKQDTYGQESENCPDDDFGTSHLSIIAEDGSAVAVTSSINNDFGSKVILNYLFFGYDLQKAVEEPRVQIHNTETNVEDCFDVKVTDGLRKKNHSIFHNAEQAVVQAVVREEDKVCAESDCRKGGYPAGY
ncbi:gamma-glutamyltranspeptidase 1-like protein [Labeo rohita]|uniref:Gamma-glutamyltranspeptidase 1-like protein n=1 Tax=Labeo rohita TaxID=84645 RepID=A0A498NHV9_LABRO|nr:gamma-glutamyltranspeptidase 1-like protein [Labeo rohita]